MLKYIIKRVLISILVFVGITFLVFVMAHFAPGGPLDLLTADANLSPEAYEALEKALGLDRPIIVQYANWLSDFIQGDWGISYRFNSAVSDLIIPRIGPTLLLMGTSLGLALLLAIPLGILVSIKPYGALDYLSNAFAFLGQAVPTFFYSLVLIYLFSVRLGWLPMLGMNTTGHTDAWDTIKHMIMPVMVLSWHQMASFIRYTRASMLESRNAEHVKTARSKGLSPSRVQIKHIFRNALIPIVTQIGLQVPLLIGGAVVVEQIFSWPGIGSLLINSILYRDYTVIMGITCLIAVAVLGTNLVLDIIYAKLDPRISYK
ncbi:MAG: ABC transporter permease [Clostridia bacterium]|nr:ABC transporter permease [Clostridia bacterium]